MGPEREEAPASSEPTEPIRSSMRLLVRPVSSGPLSGGPVSGSPSSGALTPAHDDVELPTPDVLNEIGPSEWY